MNLKKLILTKNECYTTGRTITPKGIMVHSTGANNANLRRYVNPDDGLLGHNPNNNHWNQARPDNRQVCVHAFIGRLADGSIATYQTLPWNHRGWHSGNGSKGSANDTHISFEICEDSLNDADYLNDVYKEATELCAYLCKEYKLDPMADGIIIGHFEGHKRGIASNHGDPHNWFPRHGKSMDTFRTEVKRLLGSDNSTTSSEPPPHPPSFQPYTVKVKVNALNIRKGAGTNTAVVGIIKDKGVYTIVKESSGTGASKWGRLKSYAGWISLDHVQRL